jgi:hypothetical protein
LPQVTINKKFRAAGVDFTQTGTVTQIGSDPNTKQITTSVSWIYSGKTYTHSVTTIMRQE